VVRVGIVGHAHKVGESGFGVDGICKGGRVYKDVFEIEGLSLWDGGDEGRRGVDGGFSPAFEGVEGVPSVSSADAGGGGRDGGVGEPVWVGDDGEV